jgi:hypothetical protein
MDTNDTLQQLQALGITLPTPAYIVGAILFGFIGLAAYYYGKKKSRKYVKWLGVALMLYPYVIQSTWMMYVIGVLLCGACYYYRDR